MANYIGDPAIINGDLSQRGGDWERVLALNNEILILLGTEKGYWGNKIESTNSQIPGGLEELDCEAINTAFLNRYAAKVESCLSTMITNGDAREISVEAYNPLADKIEYTVNILLPDGKKYYYDSATGTGEFA